MLAVEVAKYLDNQGVGVFDEAGVSGNIFISTLPPKPDTAIAVYPRAGREADPTSRYAFPSIQIIVRGTHPVTAYELAQSVYDALHGFANGTFVPTGTWIVGCLCAQSCPAFIGQDENNRYEYSLNFNIFTS